MESSPESMPVAPGELLAGKYRVEDVIGSGGMGVVVSAVDVTLRRRVAIKLLREATLRDSALVARFVREGRAVARLRTEHVARVLDAGVLDDGRPFLVIEHLEGHDLSALVVADRMLPVDEAVAYVVQACEGVRAAHAAGIVHRDLKPGNLFLARTENGPLVKVLDFGISKMTGDPLDGSLTMTQDVIGSPSFMSPEQLRSSRHVDARTDIWALGVILYQLLTKALPFHGDNLTELITSIVSDEPRPLHELRPDVPRGLSDVIARCLAKRIDTRVATVDELASLLAPYAVSPEWNDALPSRSGAARDAVVVTPRGALLSPASEWAATSATPPRVSSAPGAITSLSMAGVPTPPAPGAGRGRRPVVIAAGVALAAATLGAGTAVRRFSEPTPARATGAHVAFVVPKVVPAAPSVEPVAVPVVVTVASAQRAPPPPRPLPARVRPDPARRVTPPVSTATPPPAAPADVATSPKD